MKTKKLKDVCICAFFAAMLAICSQICFLVPGAVSITLQTFAVAFCGYYLGVKRALLSVLAYVLLGIVGIPVFSGLTGGAAVLFGVSGGFIIGFFPLCALCATFNKRGKFLLSFALGLMGLIICHISGVAIFSLVAGATVWSSFIAVSLPYLIKDIVSVFLALCLARRLPII